MKTESTKINYLNRAVSLMEKAYKEALIEENKITENPFIFDFNNRKIISLSIYNTSIWAKKYWSYNLRSSTWRQYRASLKFLLELLFKEKKISQEVFDKTNLVLDNTKSGNKKNLELRTSSKKSKNLNIKDLKLLDVELKKSKNKWSNPTRLWIRAGILTGLRPIEWKTAEINDNGDDINLIVINAKNTNGRSHGEKRTINLNHLPSNEVNIIKEHLRISKEFSSNNLWNDYYIGCSNILRYIGKKLWKNRERKPSLYTTRHQFSANSKASGCTPRELAALMGHASELTAQMTYGKKIYGRRGKKPKAKKSEMKNIRVNTKKLNKFSFDNY